MNTARLEAHPIISTTGKIYACVYPDEKNSTTVVVLTLLTPIVIMQLRSSTQVCIQLGNGNETNKIEPCYYQTAILLERGQYQTYGYRLPQSNISSHKHGNWHRWTVDFSSALYVDIDASMDLDHD